MNRKIYKIKCEYCGKEIETTVYFKRFCNESHRQMGHQQRKREEKRREKQNSK